MSALSILALNLAQFLQMKKPLMIIGLISVTASLILVSLPIKTPVSPLKRDLPISLLKDCSLHLEQVNQSDWLETANVIRTNLVSVETLRKKFIPVSECAKDLNFYSFEWREAWFILDNLPSYQSVSDPLKQTLQNELNDFQFQLSNLLREVKDSQLSQSEKFYNYMILTIALCCSIFLILLLIYSSLTAILLDY